MNVLWIGTDLYKAYHDPQTGRIDVLASRYGTEGTALAPEPGLEIVVDEGEAICSIAVQLDAAAPIVSGLPHRPAECLSAVDAEVEVVDDAHARWSFEPQLGVLVVAFDGVEPERWGRLGDNLIWLALDGEARLAAVVVEGVSRDPGGRGQLAWLDELGVE